MPASATLAVPVITNTPRGKRRQTLNGIVEDPASTTHKRLSSAAPRLAGWNPLRRRRTSEPRKRAIASAMSTRTPEFGPPKKELRALAKDDMALQVSLWCAAPGVPPEDDSP